ncbi:MAG: hypothetical protein HOH74_23780, partial [Gemmatimonadetes bacterium]|nr:hypothetical protein [Gemmatimonadota bacterium]
MPGIGVPLFLFRCVIQNDHPLLIDEGDEQTQAELIGGVEADLHQMRLLADSQRHDREVICGTRLLAGTEDHLFGADVVGPVAVAIKARPDETVPYRPATVIVDIAGTANMQRQDFLEIEFCQIRRRRLGCC